MARAAEDFDAFYEDRRAAAGEPVPEESVVVLTFDGKGVVLHRDDLREATRKAAERRRQQREPLSVFNRLRPGEKKHAKRMATVAAVYAVAPLVRSPEEFLQSLMPRQPADNTKKTKKAKTPAVRGHSGEIDHLFRWQTDHLFRRKPITCRSEATREFVMSSGRPFRSMVGFAFASSLLSGPVSSDERRSMSVIDDDRCGSVGISRPGHRRERRRSPARFPTDWGRPPRRPSDSARR